MFVLFNFIIALALSLVEGLTGIAPYTELGVPTSLYSVAVLLPALAVGVRRLHDTNRSGWWLLLYAVPVIGLIVLVVFLAQDSDPAKNRYGPNPKGAISPGNRI
jgi:uncharacterized membrane protein YhaH (DUF805 family)